MKQLKQWWDLHQYLVLAVFAFIVAGLIFLSALFHGMSLLRGVQAILLAAVGVNFLKRHSDGPSEK